MNFQRKQQLGPATSYALQIVVAKGESLRKRKICITFLLEHTNQAICEIYFIIRETKILFFLK